MSLFHTSKTKPKNTTSRRRHTNSKLGCLNCKTKKVRCDETLPICQNCSRGKNSICSYLKLSKTEINKIKLTHSLRDSQNKLLNQDYRLPTSSNGNYNSKGLENSENSLEFHFELTNLPLRMPLIRLPPIQFNYLTINDFSNEFNVINDDSNLNVQNNKVSTVTNTKTLKGALHKTTKFKLINHTLPNICGTKDQNANSNALFDGPDWKQDMKYLFMDILCLFNISSFGRFSKLASEAFVAVGQAIIVGQLTKDRKFLTNESANIRKYINKIENSCYDKHRILSVKIEKEVKIFVGSNITPQNRKNIILVATYLSRAVKFIGFINILLNISVDSFLNLSKIREKLISFYFENIGTGISCLLPSFKYMIENQGYKIICIGIPSYKPSFFLEVLSNLKSLSYLYSQDLIGYRDIDLKITFLKLSLAYKNLLEFLDDLSTQAFSERNEGLVTTYSPKLIFKFLQKWYSILPIESTNYHPIVNPNFPEESRFCNDIKTTLYLYYHAIGASLDSLFPACAYLFDSNFMSSNGTFYYEKNITTVNNGTKYHRIFRTADKLQRHNYYSMRLRAFFKRRYNFYINHLKCEKFFNERIQSNRFGCRTFKSLEIPIESFNTTLIRPEHYPTKLESSSNNQTSYDFVRTDEAILRNIYARNIEKLSFFNESSILQYDYASMSLLRDYRPDEGEFISNKPKIQYDDLKSFFEDKFILLEATRNEKLTI